jgi:beta-galactosidase
LEISVSGVAGTRPPAATLWCDILKPTTAQVVANYTRDYYAGKPAITLNPYGNGKAIYIGTFGDALMYERLSGWLINLAGVHPAMNAPVGVEVSERWQGEERLLFVMNHSADEAKVTLDGEYTNLLNGAKLNGKVVLPGREVWVLVKD